MASETDLVTELQQLCEPHDPNNRTKQKEKYCNIGKTARIFHQLGVLYKSQCSNKDQDPSQTKYKLIQSAALLNSALARQPHLSEEIKKDLRLLCVNLLQSSKAQNQACDLIDFAKNLKTEIEEWRKKVKDRVDILKKIDDKNITEKQLKEQEQHIVGNIKALQSDITDKYKHFMAKVSQKCIEVLGDSPCEFSLGGMGSIARKEITPFSDFENFLLLQEGTQKEASYEDTLEYFRWYAVIFQIILINLEETILPSVAIASLNDFTSEKGDWFFDAYTKSGISFDGMMPHACKTMLGRQKTKKKPWKIELIKPVSEMAEYLTPEQDLKNGYHLADILSNTCFVAGSEKVYQMFEETKTDILKKAQHHTKQEIIDIIKKDMKNHSTKLGISSTIDSDSFNVKRLAYRSTTTFITGIAKLNGIEPGSCFELVQRMQDQKLITETFSHKLQYAVAIACEIRLKTYLERGYQSDNIALSEEADEDISVSLIDAVGKRSCYDYFEIACCLQYDAIAFFKFDIELYLFHSPVTMCIAISSLLRMYDRLSAAKKYVDSRPLPLHQPEMNDDILSSSNELVDGGVFWSKFGEVSCDLFCSEIRAGVETVENQTDSSKSSKICLGTWYEEMHQLNQKLTKFYSSKPDLILQDSSATEKDLNEILLKLLWDIGKLLFKREVFSEAEYCFKVALKTLSKSLVPSRLCERVECLLWIGKCLAKTRRYDHGLKIFRETLDSYESLDKSARKLEYFEGDCFLHIGVCQSNLGMKNEAFSSFDSALNEYGKFGMEKSDEVGYCMLSKGICLCDMNRFEEALKLFEDLQLYYSNCDSVSPTSKANCLYHLGFCLQNLNCYDKASDRLSKAIQLYEKNLKKEKLPENQAVTLIRIGNCYKVINEHEKALESFKKSLQLWKELYQVFSDDPDKCLQLSIAIGHKRIGNCYFKYNFCQEAIEHYKQSLRLFKVLCRQRQSLRWNVYDLHRCLGGAYRSLGELEKACDCYLKCFNLTNEETPKKILADLNRQLGDCWKQQKEFSSKGLELINLALSTYTNLYETEDLDKRLLLRYIGLCHQNLGQNEETRKYFEQFIKVSQEPECLLSLVDRIVIAKVYKMIGVSWITDRDWESAIENFDNSLQVFLELPESLEYEHIIASLHNKIGDHLLHKYRENEAKSKFEKVEARREVLNLTISGKQQLAKAYQNFGRMFHQQSKPNYQTAIKYNTKALDLFEALNRENVKKDVAALFKQNGICFRKLRRFESAIKNFQKAETIYEQELQEKPDEIAVVWKNLGMCYQNLKRHDEAINNFRQYHETLSRQQDQHSPNNNRDEAWVFKRMAISYEALRKSSKAKSCYQHSLSIHTSFPVEEQNEKDINFIKNKLSHFRESPGRRQHNT